MAVVIDEIESNIEPDTGIANEAGVAEPITIVSAQDVDELAANLRRLARRQARLMAD